MSFYLAKAIALRGKPLTRHGHSSGLFKTLFDTSVVFSRAFQVTYGIDTSRRGKTLSTKTINFTVVLN
jgi:hypothetical protein